MVRIYIRGYEIERGVHVLSQEQYEKCVELEDEGELDSAILDDAYDYIDSEWYEGIMGGCVKILDDDDVSVEIDGCDDRDLSVDEFQISNTDFDLKCEVEGEEGTHVLVAQHISKGGYYGDIDIDPDTFDAAKLKFVTSTYTGEYLYSDRTIDYVEYDGEEVYLECDGTNGKSFEVSMIPIEDVRADG